MKTFKLHDKVKYIGPWREYQNKTLTITEVRPSACYFVEGDLMSVFHSNLVEA